MKGIPAELVLFVGGIVVTIAVSIFVVVLLIRANREHNRVVEKERAELDAPPKEAPR